MMYPNEQKQQFSFAYVRAIAATAGYAVSKPEVDDDSIDLHVAARGGAGIQIQVKCTSRGRDVMQPSHVTCPLGLKNYNDLRREHTSWPRLLVVVVVPNSVSDWIEQSEDWLMMRHCAYWLSLQGLEESRNKSSVTVHLPRKNVFCVKQLRDMMRRIAEKEGF